MSDSLHRRGQAIEDLFFAESDRKLLAEIRHEIDKVASRAVLEAATGISDIDVLDALSESGIKPESLASVALIPLVALAWCDNKLEDNEKTAILKAADEAGIRTGGASYNMLEIWFSQKPDQELFDAWKSYIGSLKSSLDEVSLKQLKNSVVSRTEEVAKAAGGYLRMINKISDSERRVIDEVSKAFE